MKEFDFSEYQEKFSENFRALLDSRGISPKSFIIESGIPDATVYRYLHKQRVPKIDNIIFIAQYFGVSIDWLLGLSPSEAVSWSDNAVAVADLYCIASPDDRRVVDTVLEKYKGV